jgi:hypothetical protein
VAGGSQPTAATGTAVPGRLGHKREERGGKERRERRKKGRALVQVKVSHVNRTGMTGLRRLLWRDWWTHGARRLDRQSRHSRQRDSVASQQTT